MNHDEEREAAVGVEGVLQLVQALAERFDGSHAFGMGHPARVVGAVVHLPIAGFFMN